MFPQSDLQSGGIKFLENNKLKIFGIPGEVKVKWHRPWKGRCKQVSIKRQADKFFIILSCDEVPLEPLAKTNKTIALDLGLTSFITSDDGEKIQHPKPYKTAKEKLAIKNRKLAAKQKGSNNRKKAKQALSKEHEKVYNIRDNFLHQVAQQLVKENDVIIIEKLNVKTMLEAKGFEIKKENITDASWARFASLLSYKAERAGKQVIEVDPRNTSKMCSHCNNIKDNLTLRDRKYNCEACGFAMDRDQNAALNIKRLGMSLAADKPASEAISFNRW